MTTKSAAHVPETRWGSAILSAMNTCWDGLPALPNWKTYEPIPLDVLVPMQALARRVYGWGYRNAPITVMDMLGCPGAYRYPRITDLVTGRVSVVIPVRGAHDYLSKCLASLNLSRSSLVSFDVAVVCSEEEAPAVSEAIMPKLVGANTQSIAKTPLAQGFAANVNDGFLRCVVGEFALILNSDTEFAPGGLEDMLKVLCENPETMMVCATKDGDGKPIDFAPMWCALVRTKAFYEVRGLCERYGTGNWEDNDFCLKLRLRYGEAAIRGIAGVCSHAGGKSFEGLPDAVKVYERLMVENRKLYTDRWNWVREMLVWHP